MNSAGTVPDHEFEVRLPEFYIWQELAIVFLTLMDLCWGTIWVDFFISISTDTPPSTIFIILAISMFGSYWIYKGMNVLKLKTAVQRGIYLVFLAVVILVSVRVLSTAGLTGGFGELLRQPFASFLNLDNPIPAEFIFAVGILFFGWRGIRFTGQIIGPKKITNNFRLGFLFISIFVLVIATMRGQAPFTILVIFFGSALLAMGTSRIAILAIIRGGAKSPFSWQWFFGLVLSIFGALILAILFAVLISNYGADLIVFLLRILLALIFLIVSPIVLFIVYLLSLVKVEASGIVSLLGDILDRLSSLLPVVGTNIDDLLENLRDFSIRWGPQARLLICSSVILVIVAFMLLRLHAIRKERRSLRNLAIETEISGDGILFLLMKAIRDGLTGLGDLFVRTENRREAIDLASFRVRQIYADLEDLSTTLGMPRRIAQTPREYISPLRDLFIGCDADLSLITEAYIQVRYGEMPENEIDLSAVEQAWSHLSGFGEELKSHGIGKS